MKNNKFQLLNFEKEKSGRRRISSEDFINKQWEVLSAQVSFSMFSHISQAEDEHEKLEIIKNTAVHLVAEVYRNAAFKKDDLILALQNGDFQDYVELLTEKLLKEVE